MSAPPSRARRALPYALLGLFAALLLGLIAWWALPEAPTTPSGEEIVKRRARKKGKVRMVQAPAVASVDDFLPLEDDPNIPVVTKTCKWLVTDERRNVPQWVMLDNLRDRAQLFVEDDIRCLTAAGVTPAILDFAERYQDRNAILGSKRNPNPAREIPPGPIPGVPGEPHHHRAPDPFGGDVRGR